MIRVVTLLREAKLRTATERSTCTEPIGEEKFSHACFSYFLTSEGRSVRHAADVGSDLGALLRLYAESRDE